MPRPEPFLILYQGIRTGRLCKTPSFHVFLNLDLYRPSTAVSQQQEASVEKLETLRFSLGTLTGLSWRFHERRDHGPLHEHTTQAPWEHHASPLEFTETPWNKHGSTIGVPQSPMEAPRKHHGITIDVP